MDAIFQYPIDYMDESINRFKSYMEKASLQLQIELEEYATSSSSIYVNEGVREFNEKLKRGIKLIITRLKEFIQDTRVNIEKYMVQKKVEKRIAKIAKWMHKSNELKNMQVKYKDRSARARFIKKEKAAMKRMFRKKNTKAEELKVQFQRYKEQLSILEKAEIAYASSKVIQIISNAFVNGLQAHLDEALDDAEYTAEELAGAELFINASNNRNINESVEGDEVDVKEMSTMITEYSNYITTMSIDEINVWRETFNEYMKILDKIEVQINVSINNESLEKDIKEDGMED